MILTVVIILKSVYRGEGERHVGYKSVKTIKIIK